MKVRYIVAMVLVVACVGCGQSSSPTMPNATCAYSLSPEAQSISSAGGVFAAMVITEHACGWTVTADEPWIGITAGSTGVSTGNASHLVAITTGALRRGTITAQAIGGSATTTVTILQGRPLGRGRYLLAPEGSSHL